MISKEKARELFYKFSKEVSRDFKSDSFISAKIAKQCALIAVDEIIELDLSCDYDTKEFNYWNKVKSEIEKL